MGPGRRPLRCCFFRDPEGNLLELIELGDRPGAQR
jgi:hypothetical protein